MNIKLILVYIFVFIFVQQGWTQNSDGELTWLTFQGGSGSDINNAVALDRAGNIYAVGRSGASWGSPVRSHQGDLDAHVVKLDSDGTLLWHTFLGGTAGDIGNGVTVDANGNIYVIGSSEASWGFPVRAYSGGYQDIFIAKLDNDGNLLWNTFLGSTKSTFPGDNGYGIAVDDDGYIYAGGVSDQTWGSPIRAYTSDNDALIAKLNVNGNLLWHTFLGGSGSDLAGDIVLDGNGNIYGGGNSSASWGSSPLRAFSGGARDGFIVKLDTSGTLSWHTFLGGSGEDQIRRLTLDSDGNLYAAGYSDATWGSPVRAFTSSGTNGDGVAIKLNNSGTLIWNTFLGGSGIDYCHAIAVDNDNFVYVSGQSNETWGSPVRAYGGGNIGGFTTALESDGELVWNTFQGGTGFTLSYGVAVTGNGNIYVAGYSTVSWGSPIHSYSSSLDGWVVKYEAKLIPVWHEADQKQASGTGESGSVDRPDNVSDGDLIILVFASQNSRSGTDPLFTAPEGFTLIRSEQDESGTDRPEIAAYWKIATESEPAGYEFTRATGTNAWKVTAGRVTGHDPVNPISTTSGDNSGSSGVISLTIPGLTTTNDNSLVIGAVSLRGDGAAAADPVVPAEMSQVWAVLGEGTGSSGQPASVSASEGRDSTGETGTRQFTWTGTNFASGLMFAVNPPIDIDNFLVEAEGGGAIPAQKELVLFNIRITARDGENNTVTGFTGTVEITSTGTLSAGGGTTANFVGGVLESHSVKISNTGNFTITATRTGGAEAGTSNSFEVVEWSGPLWHSADQKQASGTGESGSVDRPDNVSGGDLIILVFASQNSRSGTDPLFTAPEGFTLIRSEQDESGTDRPEIAAYWKIATGSEPAGYEFTRATGTNAWKVTAGRVTGHDPVNPISTTSGDNSGSSGVISLTIPGLTTTNDNSLVIGAVSVRGDGAAATDPVVPAEMSQVWAVLGEGTGNSGQPASVGVFEKQDSTGEMGTREFIWTGTNFAAGLMFAINPPFTIDNFLVETEGGGDISTQTEGFYFNIRVTARDEEDNIVTGFSGTVEITSTGTLSAGGGTTANFVDGMLESHSVKISNTGNFTITATRTGGSESGTSNTFDVVPWLGPIWHEADQKQASGTGESGSVDRPDNVSDGDLIILVFASQNSRSGTDPLFTAPEGFTLIRSEQDESGTDRPEIAAYWKIATGSEPAGYEFTRATGTNAWKVTAGRVTGHDPVNPISTTSGDNSGSSGVTSLTIPGLTTTNNNSLVIGAVSLRGDGAAAADPVVPAEMSQVWAVLGEGTGSSGQPASVSASEGRDSTGETGTRQFTWTGTNFASGLMFVINPVLIDNFVVEARSGGDITKQIEGFPFYIRITARDGENNTVTGFTGTIEITSTGTLSAGGGTTANFVGGVLELHSVKISNTGNFTITATRTGGAEAGTSNSFEVVEWSGPLWHSDDQKQASGTGESGSVDRPDNVSGGDLIILVFASQNSRSGTDPLFTAPEGFTLIRSEQDESGTDRPEIAAYWKIATGSEPAGYEFTRATGTNAWKVTAGRVTGHDPVDPINTTSGDNSGSSGVTSLTIPGLTTTNNNSLVIGAVSLRGDGAAAADPVVPAEMSQVWAVLGEGTGSSGQPAIIGAAEERKSAGATGSRQFGWTGTNLASGLMFAIDPIVIDNFLVEAEGGGDISTQIEKISFNIRITARDSDNNTVTGFTGTVEITSTGTLSEGGGTTANFVEGVLESHTVEILQTGNHTITASRTGGIESGTSNSFNVTGFPWAVWHADDQKTANLSSGSSISVNTPDNLSIGDLIIVVVSTRDGSVISSTDPGFTLIRQEHAASSDSDRPTTAAFYKIATADEPVSYTFTRTGTTRDWRIVAGRVTGHHPLNPIGVHSGANSGGTDVSSIVVPQLITSDDNVLIIAAASTHNTNTISGPGGMDQLWNVVSPRPGSRGVSEIRTTAGATGSRTFTFSSNNKSSALMFEILPLIKEPPGVPDDPTYSDILISSVRVNWTIPATGGAPELYRIERASDVSGSPGTFSEIGTTGELFYDDSDLFAGNTYWYRVRGENIYGSGSYSNAAEVTIVPGVPSWYTGDQKQNVGTGASITVGRPDNLAEGDLIIVVVSARDDGTVTANNSTFELIRHESAGTTDNDRPITAAFWKIATGSEPASYSFTKTAGNIREWRITAGRVTDYNPLNPIGTHSGSNSGSSTVSSSTIPGITTSDNNTLLVAAWSMHDAGISTPSDPEGMEAKWSNVTPRPPNYGAMGARPDEGPTGDKTISWTSKAVRVSGVMFEIMPMVAEPPGAPGDPTCSNVSASSVVVNWTAPTTGGVLELYRIERAPDVSGSPGTFTEIGTTDELFYNDSDLFPGNTYWYRIRGENAYGLGDYSSATDVTVVAGVPVWHSSDRKTASGSGSSISVDRPDNVSAGDLIIVITQARDGGTIGQNESYFTLIRHESGNVDNDLTITAVWSRIATVDEPASYGFTRTAGNARNWRAIAGRVTGHNPITPTGNHSGVNPGSSKNESSVTIPSITTSRDNTLLMAIMTVAREKNASGINHPSGMTAEWTNTGLSDTPASAGSTERQETEGNTGTRQYSWTGTDGASGVMFEILPISQPMITVVNPDEGAQGATGVEFTVTGTDFQDTPTISFSGLGITVTNVTFESSTELTVTIDIAQGTTIGNRNITIENPDGGTVTAVDAFTVTPGPVFTSVNPVGLAQWASGVELTITGTNFQVTPAVSFSGTGIDVTAITRDSDTLLTITVDIAQDAVIGNRNLTIQNPDGGTITASDAFTVHPGPEVETTSITAYPAAIPADGEYMSTITVQLKDADGNNVNNGGYTVTLSATAGTLSDVTENHDGTYTATLTSSTTPTIAIVMGTLNTLSIDDDAQVEFYEAEDVMLELSGNAGWRMLVSPVMNMPVSDISGSLQITGYDDLREFKNFFTGYNGLRFMAPADLSGNLTGGKGFIVYPTSLPVVIQTNGFAQPDDVTVSLHADGNGLNLLGNPFKSSFDITQIIPVGGSLISSVAQIWKPDTLSSVGGSFMLTTHPAIDGIIAPWQGFFIENDDATGITMPVTGKSIESRDVIQKTSEQPERGLIALALSGNDAKNGVATHDRAAILYFHEDAGDDWDLWDASKLVPLSSPFATLSFSGIREGKSVMKAQESRPYDLAEPIEIPLHVTVRNMSGEFTISWERWVNIPDAWDVYFIDQEKNNILDLRRRERYSFIYSEQESKKEDIADLQSDMTMTAGSPARFKIVIDPGKVTSYYDNYGDVPLRYELYQNYPNPFNSGTKIRYDVAHHTHLTITIYDILGRRVSELVSAFHTPGTYEVYWDASANASGVYIFRMNVEKEVFTKRMVLVQ
jgi:hypothetical protein